ncbi:auxilin-related protein 2 [Lactuca sativa]|uniref:J domain-containing protein n=1 Tax=Lactuca sativa TaxID=4236 RepID=A0A9R1XH06_LACSA|nr:auxilin-related protein 2 [Lactuca sativa]KAJ0207617.1 hypothetical protein LSAT_V11C500293320 [Lactuca sativa]
MDEFGMLAKDFGFRPQGKSAPMKSIGGDRRSRNSPSSATFAADGKDIFNDVFGGPPKYTNSNSKSTSSMSDFDYDSIFKDSVSPSNNETKTKPTSSNSPVYDKPVYDDDIFDGLPGIKSTPVSSSSPRRYDDNIFASMNSSPPKPSPQSGHFDDLFSSLGRTEKAQPSKNQSNKSPGGFDDLIPGFGSGSPASGTRWNSDPSPKSAIKRKEKSNATDDPFAVLESMSTPVASASSQGLFTDPLEEISRISKSKSTKKGGDVFGDIDSLNGLNKSSSPSSTKETNNRGKGSEEGSSIGSARSSIEESFSQKSPFEDHQSVFDMPAVSRNSPTSHTETNSQAGPSPKSEHGDDIWLTVSEIPLFTAVTKAPPPSRPPPPIPSPRQSSSPLDELEGFVREKEHTNASRSKEEEQEKERVREKTRQAVERATREARDRAASEARLKSERAAVQRAQAEARERAAVEAKGRAERAAAEARERASAEKAASEAKEKEAREKAAVAKAQAEARRRAERAAVERVTAEARERAAAEARDRAAAAATAAKVNQQKNDNDLDSFFNMGSRPNSVPKSRTSSDSATDPLSQERRAPEVAHRASSSAGAPSNVRKTSPTTNFVDDLSSIFGAATPGVEFQDVEGGETEERRRANMERDQRIEERVAKALAEKNERDMQSQKEQEERQRISATLDVEIKRWAAGKEGNLRAMLSTLQYVLWPECGWQAVSLTDLISGGSVKKAYRKATLCIHPDKVQQKGATLQQKYVAEKVFDLLKEAWNKFNSEELF